MSTTLSRGQGTAVAVASGVSALAGYLVLWLAARVLTTAENADFLAFWGLLFFVLGTLGGLQSEVTRAVHAARAATRTGRPDATASARPLAVGLGIGLTIAATVALTSPLWGRAALGDGWPVLVALVAGAAVLFAGHSAVAGTLAGAGHWRAFAGLVAGESTLRLVLALAAAGLGAALEPTTGLPVAAAAATGAWLLATATTTVRAAVRHRVPGSAATLTRGAGHAMIGTASSAALVVGFAVLVRLTTPDAAYAAAAPLLLAVQLTRAPLMIPLGTFQGVAITHFLDHRDQGLRPLARVAGAVTAVGAVGAGLAALLGPWLMTLLFGPDYHVGPGVLAALTLAAAALAVLTITGAATLALDGHRAFAAGWLLATLACAALMLTGLDLTGRVLLGLGLGPLVGIGVHLGWLRRAGSATPSR